MISADPCALWDYKKDQRVPNVRVVCNEFASKIRLLPDGQFGALRDTRKFHEALFRDAVPAQCAYLAGNYRGSEHSCLRLRVVGMGQRIGASPADVARLMGTFHASTLVALGYLTGRIGRKPDHAEAYLELARFVADVISNFQDIHPYADGNGHIGRLLAWVVMGHYNLAPAALDIHENPGWDADVASHQEGNPQPLVRILMERLY